MNILPQNIERESSSMCDFPVLREGEDLELSKHVGWVAHKEMNEGRALYSDRLLFTVVCIFIFTIRSNMCFPILKAVGCQKRTTTKKKKKMTLFRFFHSKAIPFEYN